MLGTPLSHRPAFCDHHCSHRCSQQHHRPDLIYPGQELIIPVTGDGAPLPPSRRTVETNGYIFPLSETTLRRILTPLAPHLTYVSVFSFPVDGQGGLTYTPGQAAAAVRVARSLGIVPLLVISNFDGTNFNPDLARSAMTPPAVQSTVSAIVNTAAAEGFGGVNVDFENMYPEDRQPTRFHRGPRRRPRPQAVKLSNAMAPKWADWPTLPWVGTFDYATLGQLLDFTMLMTVGMVGRAADGGGAGEPGPASVGLRRRAQYHLARS